MYNDALGGSACRGGEEDDLGEHFERVDVSCRMCRSCRTFVM